MIQTFMRMVVVIGTLDTLIRDAILSAGSDDFQLNVDAAERFVRMYASDPKYKDKYIAVAGGIVYCVDKTEDELVQKMMKEYPETRVLIEKVSLDPKPVHRI